MKHLSAKALLVIVSLLLLPAVFSLAAEDPSIFEQIDPIYYKTDVNELIEIDGPEDIAAKRKALIGYVWGDEGFPRDRMPADVEHKIQDDRYAELFKHNLKQIDKITVRMTHGFDSVAYHFVPKTGNKHLALYHQGHRGDFVLGIDTICAFLEKGYSVMAFSMPLRGMNNKPIVKLKRFGRFSVTTHEHLKLLERPMRFFLEPMAVCLNYAVRFKYDRTVMIGISGGGWTTTLYAAVDARVSSSYPVAGSLPIYLRSQSKRDWGDYEQTLPQLYRIANYLELYIMGAHGTGRKQMQILNKYDSCCFAGIKYRTYERTIKQVVADLGPGRFDIFLDESHKEHKISDEALKIVFAAERQ
jgi:hypothetical protein